MSCNKLHLYDHHQEHEERIISLVSNPWKCFKRSHSLWNIIVSHHPVLQHSANAITMIIIIMSSFSLIMVHNDDDFVIRESFYVFPLMDGRISHDHPSSSSCPPFIILSSPLETDDCGWRWTWQEKDELKRFPDWKLISWRRQLVTLIPAADEWKTRIIVHNHQSSWRRWFAS